MKYFVLALALAFTLCVAMSAMAASNGGYYDEQYEMNNANGINGYNLVADSSGSGFTFSGGIGTYLDSGSTGSLGLYAPSSLLVGSGAFTVDFRIKVLAENLPDYAGTAMSFKSGGSGRGLHLDTGGATFVSSGDISTGPKGWDFTQWTLMRVIQTGSSQTVYAKYNVGDAWYMLATNSAFGGTGVAGDMAGLNNFNLGSDSNSTTQQASFQLDWVRVAGGSSGVDYTYLDATAPTPEPGSLLALGSGLVGMFGFAIRRRRA